MKTIKQINLSLSKLELIHLRDLMSVLLLPGETSVSKSLAETERRTIQENLLWEKVVLSCKENDIPTENNAPDFVVGLSSAPPMEVMPLNYPEEIEEENLDEDEAFFEFEVPINESEENSKEKRDD